ncbi:MAG TPA: uroporphyrinogen decarboxylase family protein, partial [Aggregatilineales bacterium]|nr:uroporphyrinogen decarboxylase family protein [Aggregatilineales bacterium]
MTAMTSKQRMLTAITRTGKPDRLPVTTHHVMSYWLDNTMHGMTIPEFFDYFDLDAITWVVPHKPDPAKGEYVDPEQGQPGFLESARVSTDSWRVHWETIPDPAYKTVRYTFATPRGSLTMVLQSDPTTSWISEYLIKDPKDIDLIGDYMTAPKADVEAVNKAVAEFGDRGLVRGMICGFDVYGQAGCWQDAACLMGVENLIYATYDDPDWVHELLKILLRRKKIYVESLKGACYDIIEHGGGAASSTVISPKIFDKFVAPYDSELIDLAHQVGQRVVYHTCGGMMPLLERIAAMKPDAMETFTPSAMGGDVKLAEAKRRIGDKVCMIGGFDQF